jgi:hypothetical protein
MPYPLLDTYVGRSIGTGGRMERGEEIKGEAEAVEL